MDRLLHYTNPLTRGADVRLVQNLLVGVGLLDKGDVDGVFGPKTGRACVKIKRRLGYRGKDCVPSAGPALVAFLRGQKRLPSAYRARRLARLKGSDHSQPSTAETAEQRKRAAAVAWWRWAVSRRSESRYGQVRPIQWWTDPHRLPCTTDCSGDATKAARAAGLPDPNGRYDGLGFTGTMLDHCHQLTPAEAQPADYAVFGRYPGHHVVTLLRRLPNGDWEVGSNGHQGDPGTYLLSSFVAVMGRPTLLSAV